MVGGLRPSGGGPRVLRLPRRRREAPLELRVLFINVVFFFWVIFLSLVINDKAASGA